MCVKSPSPPKGPSQAEVVAASAPQVAPNPLLSPFDDQAFRAPGINQLRISRAALLGYGPRSNSGGLAGAWKAAPSLTIAPAPNGGGGGTPPFIENPR